MDLCKARNSWVFQKSAAPSMNIFRNSPYANEICAERVKPLRFAEVNGDYDAFFKRLNGSSGG
jgi:short-subunit dehydrogenase involved in D-alanine esterification of teichoic acids